MALFDSTVTRDDFEARAKVRAKDSYGGTITFSIGDKEGATFVQLSAWDAECIARMLLNAAAERRAQDETENTRGKPHAGRE